MVKSFNEGMAKMQSHTKSLKGLYNPDLELQLGRTTSASVFMSLWG